jgi:hypothetical protein
MKMPLSIRDRSGRVDTRGPRDRPRHVNADQHQQNRKEKEIRDSLAVAREKIRYLEKEATKTQSTNVGMLTGESFHVPYTSTPEKLLHVQEKCGFEIANCAHSPATRKLAVDTMYITSLMAADSHKKKGKRSSTLIKTMSKFPFY